MLITTSEAIIEIGCDKKTIRNYIKNGALEVAQTIKNSFYFELEQIQDIKKLYENNKRHTNNKFLSEEEIEAKKIPPKKIEIQKRSAELDEVGLQVMSETIQELKTNGLYREIDTYIIMDLARAYQGYLYHFEMYMACGGIMYDAKGNEKISNHFAIYSALDRIVETKRNKLGLSPKDRQALTLEQKKEHDAMADLF